MQVRIESIIRQSKLYAQSGMPERAVEELNRGLVYRPQDDNLHYELALLYAYNLLDQPKALYHFQKCLEYNPGRLDKPRIQSEIDRLSYYLREQEKR